MADFVQTSMKAAATVLVGSKNRLYFRFRTLALLGLAFCVFTWGLQYKLSLYDPPQAVSHQIPKAKLLSRDERSGTAESPLVVRSKTSSRVIYTASAAVFFILLPALSISNRPGSGPGEQRSNRSWHLRHAILNTVFVRPPPLLA